MLINAIEPEERTAEARLIPQNLLRETPKSFDFNALACNRTRFGLQINAPTLFPCQNYPSLTLFPLVCVHNSQVLSIFALLGK